MVLVETDDGLLQSAIREVAETGCEVSSQVADRDASPLMEQSCDRIASLCTQGFWDGAALFSVAEHATRPGGCAAIVTWDPALPPLHEVALVDALRDVCGMHSRFLECCLASVDTVGAAGWEQVALHDVARFDGIGGYWAAMVVARPLAAEIEDVSDHLLSAVRAACQRALEPCTAADGTMLIPVHATMYRRAAGTGA